MRMDAAALIRRLEEAPVIASVKDEGGLERALESDAQVLFLLYGDVVGIGETAARVRGAGKAVLVHLDLVDGLAQREAAVDFIARNTAADGILTTKPQLVRRARELGLVAVQRFFLLDSMALKNIERHLGQDAPDLIEVLPGLMPKIIRRLAENARRPVVAGGLIEEKEDVVAALAAGAVAVSATNPAVWDM